MHVYQDGSIHMNHGGTEMGQGLFQKVAQVAAHRFGVGMDRVKITADGYRQGGGGGGGGGAQHPRPRRPVPAAISTAWRSRPPATRSGAGSQASLRPSCRPSRARWCSRAGWSGRTAPGCPSRRRSPRPYMARVSLSATGFYKTPKIEWDRIAGRGRPFFLLRLWRGLFGGRDRHADRRETASCGPISSMTAAPR